MMIYWPLNMMGYKVSNTLASVLGILDVFYLGFVFGVFS